MSEFSKSKHEIACKKCHDVFVSYIKESRKYCSKKCANKHNSETKEAWNKGKKTGYAPWLGKKRPDISAENHPRWKGGVSSSERHERARFSAVFQPKVLQRDNYTCQICDQYGGYLQVDHIKPWSEYQDLRFDIDNCRTVCMACHYYVTYKRKIPAGIIWGHNFSRRMK